MATDGLTFSPFILVSLRVRLCARVSVCLDLVFFLVVARERKLLGEIGAQFVQVVPVVLCVVSRDVDWWGGRGRRGGWRGLVLVEGRLEVGLVAEGRLEEYPVALA
jgi:hypothetical protein